MTIKDILNFIDKKIQESNDNVRQQVLASNERKHKANQDRKKSKPFVTNYKY